MRPQPKWKQPSLANAVLPKALRSPMRIRGSLTQFIEQAAGQTMEVNILAENWQVPLAYERRALKLKPRQKAWLRQAYLQIDGKRWVYARSVIPAKTLRGEWKILQHLRSRPLGSLLFKRKKTQRGVIQIGRAYLPMYIANDNNKQTCWARYSKFSTQGKGGNKHMLVSEYFLEDFLN